MDIWFYALSASLTVSAVSLTGAFTLLLHSRTLERLLPYLLSLAAGVLLGGSFLHLIPHALERGNSHFTGYGIVLSIILFFLLERFFRNHGPENEALGKLIIAGDGFHNFIDGLLIAAAFSADFHLGLISALAVLIHEIPQEVGDVSALIYSGFAPRQAVLYNFLGSLTAPLGTAVGLLFISWAQDLIFILIPVAAGGFIYIALSDLLPVLQTRSRSVSSHVIYSVFMILGVLLMESVHHFEGLHLH